VTAGWNRRESLILKQFVFPVSFFERLTNSVSNGVRLSYSMSFFEISPVTPGATNQETGEARHQREPQAAPGWRRERARAASLTAAARRQRRRRRR
jgi:hypothetical protein